MRKGRLTQSLRGSSLREGAYKEGVIEMSINFSEDTGEVLTTTVSLWTMFCSTAPRAWAKPPWLR